MVFSLQDLEGSSATKELCSHSSAVFFSLHNPGDELCAGNFRTGFISTEGAVPPPWSLKDFRGLFIVRPRGRARAMKGIQLVTIKMSRSLSHWTKNY